MTAQILEFKDYVYIRTAFKNNTEVQITFTSTRTSRSLKKVTLKTPVTQAEVDAAVDFYFNRNKHWEAVKRPDVAK